MLNRHIIKIIGIIAGLTCGLAAYGEVKLDESQQKVLLQEAQTLFEQGTQLELKNPEKAQKCYRLSADKFQIVVDSGVKSGWLYYNLGNALLKRGKLGAAIANYKRAEQYLGDESKLEENLDYARSLCQSKLTMEPASLGGALSSLNSKFPIAVKLWIAIIAWVIIWIGGCGWLYIKKIRWRWIILPSAVICVLMTASVIWEWIAIAQQWQGVVKVQEVVIRKGNGNGYAPLYNEPLEEGMEFHILDKRRNWFEVRLNDGKVGWLPDTAVEEIKPKSLW